MGDRKGPRRRRITCKKIIRVHRTPRYAGRRCLPKRERPLAPPATKHPSGLCSECRKDGWASGTGNIRKPWPPHIRQRYLDWRRWLSKQRNYCRTHHHAKTKDRLVSIKVTSAVRKQLNELKRDREESMSDFLLMLMRFHDMRYLFWKDIKGFGKLYGKGQGQVEYMIPT